MFVSPHVRRILCVCAATHFGVICVDGILHVAARTCVAAHVWCSVLQCGAVCCSVLQCGAVWCSVLQCGTVWCSVLQWLQCVHVAARTRTIPARCSCGCSYMCDFLAPLWDAYN